MNSSDSKKLEDQPYPIQDGPTIPWSVIAPHEAQCKKNHGQSLKRLAERGGLGAAEAYCVVKGLSLDAFREHGDERLRALWYEYAESVNGLKAHLAEQDREIERLNNDLTQMNLDSMEEELRLKAELAKVRIVLEHRDGCYNAAEDRVTELKARIKELEELLGEETYAERAAVRHYKRVQELEQELLWAADACEKAEAENDDLQLTKSILEARVKYLEEHMEERLAEKEKV